LSWGQAMTLLWSTIGFGHCLCNMVAFPDWLCLMMNGMSDIQWQQSSCLALKLGMRQKSM
jgi:hypothetical protein